MFVLRTIFLMKKVRNVEAVRGQRVVCVGVVLYVRDVCGNAGRVYEKAEEDEWK